MAKHERRTFGAFFKAKRLELDMSLREFCQQNGLDAGNLSRMERGLLAPPQAERLAAYAEMLGIAEGSDDWYELFDLAAAERGKIPDDLQTEEVLDKLPILFRTLRGQKVPDEKLDELVDLMRGKKKR